MVKEVIFNKKNIKKFNKEAKEEYLKLKRKSYNGSLKESEKKLIKSSKYAALYAIHIKKKRWKKAEHQISFNKIYSRMYVNNFFKNKLPNDLDSNSSLYDMWYEETSKRIFNLNKNKSNDKKPPGYRSFNLHNFKL